MNAQVWKFMSTILLPASFMTKRCHMMLTLMLFPTVANKTHGKIRFIPQLEMLMQQIRITCFDIFKENNVAKRCTFFAEPLIQYLWNIFIEKRPDISINHLRRVRSHPLDGEYRYQMIVKDMLEMEKRLEIQIIPTQAHNSEVIC